MFCEIEFQQGSETWAIKKSDQPIGEFVFDAISHEEFAKADWYGVTLGRNVFIQRQRRFISHAFLHQNGAYVVKIPTTLLKFDDEDFDFYVEYSAVKNPPIDFDLPLLEGLPLSFFNHDFLERVTELKINVNPCISNLFYFRRSTDSYLIIFNSGSFFCFGLNEKTIVK